VTQLNSILCLLPYGSKLRHERRVRPRGRIPRFWTLPSRNHVMGCSVRHLATQRKLRFSAGVGQAFLVAGYRQEPPGVLEQWRAKFESSVSLAVPGRTRPFRTGIGGSPAIGPFSGEATALWPSSCGPYPTAPSSRTLSPEGRRRHLSEIAEWLRSLSCRVIGSFAGRTK
jgi:hypothetical protein